MVNLDLNAVEGRTSSGLVWPLSYAQAEGCTAMHSLDDAQQAAVETLAVDYLWNWTDRQFGTATVETTPKSEKYRTGRPSTFEGRGPRSALIAPPAYHSWRDALAAKKYKRTGRAARLPGVVEVLSVTLDGEPFEDWTLDKGYLLRMDGRDWPTNDESFLVEYVHGTEVPTGGQLSAGLLACEFAKSYLGDEDCQLPERLTSITRQGVSMTVMDQFEDLKDGHTGIWLIDSWVASIIHSPQPASISSPDYGRRR